MMNGMVCLMEHNMMLPLRGEFCESSQMPRALFITRAIPSPRALPWASRLTPFQGVNGWRAPKGQQFGSKGQRPVAVGEDGEMKKI